MIEESEEEVGDVGRSPFIPILGLTLVLLVVIGFQTFIFYMDKELIDAAKKNQESTFVGSKKVRLQLDSIARETARLAKSGNVNAQAIVQQLQRQGITISQKAGSVR